MTIHIGMSGYSYKSWKGGFYPADLAAEDMLRFYASRFSTVEINNTFYRMPTEKVLLQWAEQVPAGFVFGLKASRRITHLSRLKDVAEHVDYFLRTASVLEDRLGPTLFQLPPNLKKDVGLLAEFLTLVPRRWAAAVEFRHASWFDEEVYDLLRQHDCALCGVDDDEGGTPLVATSTWGYLRLRRTTYADSDLDQWAARIKGQLWEKAFIYFKHEEDGGIGAQIAQQMVRNITGSDRISRENPA